MSTVILREGPHALLRIEPEHVDEAAEALAPLLARSVPYCEGFQTVEQMIETMRQGIRAWQLWAVVDGAALAGAFITSLERVGDDLVMTFEIIAGADAQAWIAALISRFERYMAFMYGVTSMRVVGRKGWERFLAQHGYQPSHFITSKRLAPAVAEIQEFLPLRQA